MTVTRLADRTYHYYAACAYGWATAATKDGAIRALARDLGSGLLAQARRKPPGGHSVDTTPGGIVAHVTRVDLPEAAHYNISEYLPTTILREDGVHDTRRGERVPLGPTEHIVITTATGRYRARD